MILPTQELINRESLVRLGEYALHYSCETVDSFNYIVNDFIEYHVFIQYRYALHYEAYAIAEDPTIAVDKLNS